MTVRVEVVTECEHGYELTHPLNKDETADREVMTQHGRICIPPGRRSFTEWPPEAIEATAEAIYYAELPTSSFDKMGRTVPFGESMSPDQFREAAAQVVAALWDHITGKDET